MALIIKTTGFSDYLANAGGSYIKVLILGEPDSGKTRSASFWPDPIFADCENGRMSIADRQVPYGEITSRADFKALVQRVRQECQKPADKRVFNTFVWDTIDRYQGILIAERLRDERKEALSGWADWGWIGSALEQDLQSVLNLPMHIIVNLHVKDEGDGDEDSRTLVKKPKLKGDIKDQIAGQFDLVGYMEKSYVAEGGKRTLKRQIRWHSEPRYPMAKDRSGRLPRFTDIDFTDQDFQRIYSSIIGDHLKNLAESGVFEELDTGDVAPAPANIKGGPVDVEPIPAPRATAAKKTAAKKAAGKKAEPKPDTPPADGADSVPVDTKEELSEADRRQIEIFGSPEEQFARKVIVERATGLIVDKEEAIRRWTAGDHFKFDFVEAGTEEEGVANVKETLGGSEVEAAEALDPTAPTAPAEDASAALAEEPKRDAEGVPVCGDQPPQFRKYEAAKGCGKSLADENRDRVNISLLRTKTYLCSACLAAWKASR